MVIHEVDGVPSLVRNDKRNIAGNACLSMKKYMYLAASAKGKDSELPSHSDSLLSPSSLLTQFLYSSKS